MIETCREAGRKTDRERGIGKVDKVKLNKVRYTSVRHKTTLWLIRFKIRRYSQDGMRMGVRN